MFRQTLFPTVLDESLLAQFVGVRPQGQTDHIGLQTIDDRSRLPAGATVRLLDHYPLPGLQLVLRNELVVQVAPQFAGRVVGDVEQLDGIRPLAAARRGSESRTEQEKADQ